MKRIVILVILILLLTAQTAGSDLSITVDQEVIAQGDTVTFRCNVENYAGTLVYWYKRQGEDDAVQFATNGEVNHIFSNTGRYSGRIETNSGNNVFTFVVTITDAVAEDSGDIGCLMKSTEAVYVHISVVVPLSELHLYGLDTSGRVVREFRDGDQMVFNEGDQYYFQCTALGGNPAPGINLTLGGEDINDHFTYGKTFTMGSGQPGLKQVDFQAKMTTKEPIVIHKGQNALEFKCNAGVEGTEQLTICVLPTLKFAPALTCEKSQYIIPNFAPDVEVKCMVKADPSPDHVVVYWQEADGRNRSIDEHSETYGKYWMDILPGSPDLSGHFPTITAVELLLENDKSDEQVIIVRIERLFPQMFRKYTFLAQSSLGTDTQVVTLVEEPDSGESTGSTSKTSVTSLLVTFTTILHYLITYK